MIFHKTPLTSRALMLNIEASPDPDIASILQLTQESLPWSLGTITTFGYIPKQSFDFFFNGGAPEISTELSEQLQFQMAYGQMAVLIQLTLMSPSKVSLCL